MRNALAAALEVTPAFFASPAINPVREEDCHFRRLASAPRGLVAQTVARGTALEALVDALERHVRLPVVDFPEEARPASQDAIERIAETARQHWGLGLDGPITSMTRVVENAGAVVVQFDDLTDRIDALSMARRRPIIVRSTAKVAGARLRFDLAHEAAHLIMHQGVVTGDSITEGEAHRFAGAFLIPRAAFAREFPPKPPRARLERAVRHETPLEGIGARHRPPRIRSRFHRRCAIPHRKYSSDENRTSQDRAIRRSRHCRGTGAPSRHRQVAGRPRPNRLASLACGSRYGSGTLQPPHRRAGAGATGKRGPDRQSSALLSRN